METQNIYDCDEFKDKGSIIFIMLDYLHTELYSASLAIQIC